jgi:hypothetical protein
MARRAVLCCAVVDEHLSLQHCRWRLAGQAVVA